MVKDQEFFEAFKRFLEENLIEESEDGDVPFDVPEQDRYGWFISPKVRQRLEEIMNG